MDVEIHAAIVGGALSGVVLFGGILAEHKLRAQSQNRSEVRQAGRRLVVVLPRLLVPISERAEEQTGHPTKDAVWQHRSDEVLTLLETIRQHAWYGRRRAIEKAVDDIQASTSGLTLRFMSKGWTAPVTFDELVHVSDQVADLHRVLFGERETLDREIGLAMGRSV